nr:MAG: putative RNA-dependent RNA polymerase [Mitoviridae sp.]
MMASETSETIARTVYVWVSQLAHWAEVKNPGTYIRYFIPLVLHLEKLLKNNGQMEAVKYLKISLFVLYSYISGNPLKSTVPLGIGIRLSHGLPCSWDKDLRLLIRKGKLQPIRIVASLLNLYRALQAPHPDFSVETIRKPHPVMDGPLWEDFQTFCRLHWPRILEGHLGKPLPFFKYVSGIYHLVVSAGANVTGPALAGLPRDARAWFLQKENHVANWFKLHGDSEMLNLLHTAAREFQWPDGTEDVEPAVTTETPSPKPMNPVLARMKAEAEASGISVKTGRPRAEVLAELLAKLETPVSDGKPTSGIQPSFSKFFWGTRDRFSSVGIPEGYPTDEKEGAHAPILGRLHAIDEPAGKVRVVAIADYFTQVAMKPIHEHLFALLKGIKTDATFDQQGRVDEYFQQGLSPHWSFDLKSATDLIPLALYKEVLTPLFIAKDGSYAEARELVELWAKVLTDRDWLLPDGSGFVRYNTGQPMGALSSWASMAMVHHALVQFSAWKAGQKAWFTSYRVLGDDVDIAKIPAVAEFYVSSCSAFHIIIGMLKSLRSEKNVFEFANQRFMPDGNISPLSYKEELSAQSWTGRLEFARRILTRFGTSLRDKTSALLRKAATDTQWRILHSENSGLRPAVLKSLFGFCLVNPFQNWKEITIDSLVSWVLPVLHEQGYKGVAKVKNQPHRLEHFMRVFTRRLLEALRERILKKIAAAPSLGFMYKFNPKLLDESGSSPNAKANKAINAKNAFIREYIKNQLHLPAYGEAGASDKVPFEELRRLLTGFYSSHDGSPGYITQHPRRANLNRNAKFSVLYVLATLSKRNAEILLEMRKLLKSIDLEIKHLDHNFMVYFGMKTRKEIFNPFTKAIQLFADISNLSDTVVPDFEHPMSHYLSVEQEKSPATGVFSKVQVIKPESEAISVPMSAINLAFEECFGVHVSGIPLVRFTGQMNSTKGKWMRIISAAGAEFRKDDSVRQAIQSYTATARKQAARVRRGGRVEIL